MVACFAQLSGRRQEVLLYMAVSVLTANTINAVLGEWGFYTADMGRLVKEHPYHSLMAYGELASEGPPISTDLPVQLSACFATRLATAVAILLSFVDCQLSFCSIHSVPEKGKKKAKGSNEQVSDIEYIIPRVTAPPPPPRVSSPPPYCSPNRPSPTPSTTPTPRAGSSTRTPARTTRPT